MNSTDQRYPRPKPKFAGFADVVLVAVDAVATGWSEGEIGLVAGGVVLLIVSLVVAGLVAWLKVRRGEPIPTRPTLATAKQSKWTRCPRLSSPSPQRPLRELKGNSFLSSPTLR